MTFKGWDPTANPLRRSDGQLIGSVTLDTGRRYAFRYFSVGGWFNDEAADGYEPKEFGGYDCIVDLTDIHEE